MKENKVDIKKIILLYVSILIALGIYLVSNTLLFKLNLGNVYPQFISELILATLAVVIAIIYKKIDALKFTFKGFGTGLLCSLFLLITPAFILLSIAIKTPEKYAATISIFEIIASLLTALLIGIAEELLYRGTLLNYFFDFFGRDSKKNVLKAIFCSSFLFGISHITNILKGAAISGTIVQIINAVCVGVLFSAIYFRSNKNLWPAIIAHAFFDFASLISTGILTGNSIKSSIGSYDSSALFVSFIALMIGLFLLRKKKITPLLSESENI